MVTTGSSCYITKFLPSFSLLLPQFAISLGNCLCFLQKKGNSNKIPNLTKALLLPLKTQPILTQTPLLYCEFNMCNH